MLRRLLLVLLAGLAATTGRAVLGDTLTQLTQRIGSKPEPQVQKNAAVWFFEVQDGRLAYNVTFDDRGRSIAEGLKPIRFAVFGRAAVENFITAQVAPIKESKTLRVLQPGDKYVFAGREFTCGKDEYVTVDDAHDFLVVWNRSATAPSVIAIRSAMLK